MRLCSVKKCHRPSRARGWCVFHYDRWRATGNPLTKKRKADNGEPLRWIYKHVDFSGTECLNWPFSRLKRGYAGSVWLGNSKHILACRFMCTLVNGPPPSRKHVAAHSCGNGMDGCIHPSHLRWTTKQDTVGVGHPMAKLNDDKVRKIRLSADTLQSLADRYDVSPALIYQIKKRIIWKHVP